MNSDVNSLPSKPGVVPVAKRLLDTKINEEREKLMAACRSKYVHHYVMRRLTLIGIVYFSLYGALLALLKFWPEAVKGLLIKNAAQCCNLDAVGILSPYVHVGIALLLLLFSGWGGAKEKEHGGLRCLMYFLLYPDRVYEKRDRKALEANTERKPENEKLLEARLRKTAQKWADAVQEVLVNASILVVVSLVVLLPGDDESVILLRALNALVLMISGLFLNSQFGYTRAMARGRFYASKLEHLLISEGGDNTKAESYCAIMLEYRTDEYRDLVGDTFLILDTLKAKLGK
ncbi:hypothetical protein [Duganella sp. HH105]|uniref:hypothetical protein n=1 Tax=Duganella sp. HH105 TaxID=1781067 RepID=UPI000877D887|nr:hypothetical protein [Duganella sp. HH105]OEZ57188.1 hypothetical protein DUGA6_45430 [Duganella sp. HH105]